MINSANIKNFNLENRLGIYESIIGVLPQSMFLMDKDKTIVGIFNATPETLAGFSVDDVVGNSILKYANDTSSPFNQACSMLNATFDTVYATGTPLKFQYMIQDCYFEALITKLSGERVLSQVRDITDIVLSQKNFEKKQHNELTMALTAGGLTSWSFDVKTGEISSRLTNSVTGSRVDFRNLLNRIAPMYRDVTSLMFNNIKQGKSKHEEITVLVEDLSGNMVWNNIHAIPHEYDFYGSVSVIVGSQKDVTEEHQYQEKLESLNKQNELILNNNNSAFAYIMANMSVEWENLSVICPDSEMINMVVGTGDADKERKMAGNLLKGIVEKVCDTTVQFCTKYTTVCGIVLEITALPILKSKDVVEGVVLRLDDITQKERNMQELAKAKENAEKADELKSAFLANMSHEIRTPLNSIVGFAQLIHEVESDEERQLYIDIINTNSEMLLKLINDILDLSKIEAGYLEYHNSDFNLVQLFDELKLMFQNRVSEGVEMLCDITVDEYTINADKLRISQVVSNFITNAIKFTKSGYIKIGFEIIPEGVKLFVEDTGCGMSEEEIIQVFNRFEKFNKFEQGSGLGAAIAKAIVNAYGGSVGVASQKDKGSTFWAIIPHGVLNHTY